MQPAYFVIDKYKRNQKSKKERARKLFGLFLGLPHLCKCWSCRFYFSSSLFCCQLPASQPCPDTMHIGRWELQRVLQTVFSNWAPLTDSPSLRNVGNVLMLFGKHKFCFSFACCMFKPVFFFYIQSRKRLGIFIAQFHLGNSFTIHFTHSPKRKPFYSLYVITTM